MIKKFNVVAPKKYTKGQEEKTVWLQVGQITQFDNGNQILELNMLPGQTYQIFPFEKKDSNQHPREKVQAHPEEEVPVINIDDDEMPF